MSFFIKAAQAESSNGKNLYNPASGATGKYQFLPSTWADLITRKPHLGLTVDGIKDPSQQEIAMQAFTEDNRGILTKTLGPDLTDADLYGAHHFGAGGYTKIRQAPPGTPIDKVLSGAAIQANPYLRGKTTDQVRSILETKMGGPKAMTPEEELQAALAQEAGTRQPPVPAVNVGALNYPMQSHVGQGALSPPQEPEELPVLSQVMQGITGNRRDMVPGAVAPLQGFAQSNPDALLRFGAGMLSGKDFNDGLARGAAGVADANEAAQLNDFKRQQIGLQTEQQRALIERYKSLTANSSKADEWKAIPGKPGEFFRDGPNGPEFRKMDEQTATPGEEFDIKATLSKFDEMSRIVGEKGVVGPVAGSDLGRAYDKYAPGFLGGDMKQEDKRRQLDDFLNGEIVKAAEKLKPLSNNDIDFLKKGQPKPDDSPERWQVWLKDARSRIEAAAARKGVEVPQGDSRAPAAASSGDGWNATGSGVKYRIVN
jgi:hypothetical protein